MAPRICSFRASVGLTSCGLSVMEPSCGRARFAHPTVSTWGTRVQILRRPAAREVPAQRDLVVEDASTGFTGAVTRVEKTAGKLVVELEDGRGRLRSFPLGPGFMIDGKPVVLTRPAARQQPSGTKRSV